MKKCSFLIAVSGLCCAAHAISLYDSMTGVSGFVTTTQSPGYLHADGASTIASAGTGNQWEVDSIDFGMVFVGAQTYSTAELRCHFQIFATYNDNFDPVLSNPTTSFDYYLDAYSSTGNASFSVVGPTYLPPFLLPAGTTSFGWTMGFTDTFTGARIGTVRPAFSPSTLPPIGSSSVGFWRDANDNGVIEASEKGVLNEADTADNIVIRFNGRTVPAPEPATMVAMSLGLAAIIIRRRRRRV